jgi:poly-gamma-glutamate synthesis protein (capsule biosynthesis protein)
MRKLYYGLACGIFLLSGCSSAQETTEENGNSEAQNEKSESQTEEESGKQEQKDENVTIGAAGDVLLHGRVYKRMEEDGEYDFTPALEAVTPMLEEPDYTIVNQESIPGGEELGLSAYPSFNSPYAIVDDLQDAGVDMLSGANNHTLDRGMEAVNNAINHYEQTGMDYVGVYKDEEDAERQRIIDVKNIDMGVLSYTYGLNGIEVPEGDEYVVQEIDKQQIQEDIEAIRDKSDIVVVNMHWGNEYERLPNEEQKELAQFLADQEVDVVIGHHPHVLQPMEWVEGEEGNETLVYYSLGNFYSGQDHDYTDTGGIATFEVEKDGDEVKITEPNVDFTQVVPGPEDQYTVKPMAEADHPANGGETEEELHEHVYQWIEDQE